MPLTIWPAAALILQTACVGSSAGPQVPEATKLWATAAPFHTPLVASGSVVLYRSASAPYSWHALDAEDGRERWTYALDSSRDDRQAPVTSSGCILFWDSEGYLYGVNEADGHERWRSSVKRAMPSGRRVPPAITGEAAWFVTSDAIVNLDLETGIERVVVNLDVSPGSEVVAAEGLLLLTTTDGVLRAFASADGTLRWTAGHPLPSGQKLQGHWPPSVAFGRVSAPLNDSARPGWPRDLHSGVALDAADLIGCVPALGLLACRASYAITVRDPSPGNDVWR